MGKLVTLTGALLLAAAYIAFWPGDHSSVVKVGELAVERIAPNDGEQDNFPTATAAPLFTGITDSADPSDWQDVTLNLAALEKGGQVYLPSPAQGERVRFAGYETTSNQSSTSYSGVVNLNGIEHPMTITASENAVFLTVPTPLGVYSASGTPSDLKFTKRTELQDYVDPRILNKLKQSELEPESAPGVTLRVIEK